MLVHFVPTSEHEWLSARVFISIYITMPSMVRDVWLFFCS